MTYRQRVNPLEEIRRTERKDEPKSDVPPLGKDDDQLKHYVSSRASECATAMIPLQRRWVVNKALRIGHQYYIWNDTQKRLKESAAPSYRERHTTNVIDPVVRTYIAQLLQNRVSWYVIPGKMESEAIFKSKLATKVLDYHYGECRLEEKAQMIAAWMFETGSGFCKVNWDPSIGPLEEAVDDNGDALFWPGTEERMVDERDNPLTWQPGGVDIEVVSPFQMLVDPDWTGDLDECPYIIQQSIRTIDWFKNHFKRGVYVTGTVNQSEDLWLERQFTSIATGRGRGGLGPTDSQTKWNVYRECWIRPSTKYPNGRVIYLGGDVVLNVTDCPYLKVRGARPDIDWHPFVHFKCIPIPGRFWPMDVVGNLHGIQKAINRIISDCLEVQKLTSKPKWMIPQGSMQKNYRITSEAGENLWFNSAYGPPFMSKPPPAPAYVFNLLELMMKNLDFVSAQHGPTRGQAPQGVRSGIGLALLQEQDERDINPIASLYEHSMEKVGRKTLLRVAQFWDQPRLVRIMGQNEEMDAFFFEGSDVSSSFDVIVKAGSALPKSRAATLAWVKDLVNMGIYLPAMNPSHRRLVMEMLEVGTAEERIEGERQHERFAQIENIQMKRGINPKVEWYHNHDIHLEQHLNFANSDEFRRLVTEKPEIEIAWNMHIAGHANPDNQSSMQEVGRMGMPPGPQEQGGARQGSVPMEASNPKMNLQPMPGMVGLPQAAAQSNMGGGPSPGMTSQQ